MLDSTILEVAIGVIFVFMVVSIIASAINELVAGVFKWRSKELQNGLRAPLRAPETKAGEDTSLYGKIVANPLIADLGKPSWTRSVRRRLLTWPKNVVPNWLKTKLSEDRTRGPSYIPTATFGRALLDEVFPEPGDTTTLHKMRRSLEASKDGSIPPKVKQSLLSTMKDAEGDVKKFRAGVEAWYDSLMDRVSGWYGRKARWWLVVWGLLLAIVLNIDMVAITESLRTDDTVRDAVVAAAATRFESDATDGTTGTTEAATGTTEAATGTTEAATGTGEASGGDTSQVSLSAKQIEAELKNLAQLNLPIGWASTVPNESRAPGGGWGWPVRILSWAIIAAAASFGAPFWFDLLGKVSNLRMAGKKPETPKAEKL